jgi:hypothetical protein
VLRLACLALLHGSGLGLLLPFEQQKDSSFSVVLLLCERLLREITFNICRYRHRAHQLLRVYGGRRVLDLDLADSELLRERR